MVVTRLSSGYGYALFTDEGSSEEVIQSADKRMYEDKKTQKKTR